MDHMKVKRNFFVDFSIMLYFSFFPQNLENLLL